SELRIAQAQLVGWLEGLFHGIQTALVAQQMAAQAQLQEMRRALPGSGGGTPGSGSGMPGQVRGDGMPRVQTPGTGQYL
ncbi:MAG: proteasome activator, partial [Janthinobacterium lividum]